MKMSAKNSYVVKGGLLYCPVGMCHCYVCMLQVLNTTVLNTHISIFIPFYEVHVLSLC